MSKRAEDKQPDATTEPSEALTPAPSLFSFADETPTTSVPELETPVAEEVTVAEELAATETSETFAFLEERPILVQSPKRKTSGMKTRASKRKKTAEITPEEVTPVVTQSMFGFVEEEAPVQAPEEELLQEEAIVESAVIQEQEAVVELPETVVESDEEDIDDEEYEDYDESMDVPQRVAPSKMKEPRKERATTKKKRKRLVQPDMKMPEPPKLAPVLKRKDSIVHSNAQPTAPLGSFPSRAPRLPVTEPEVNLEDAILQSFAQKEPEPVIEIIEEIDLTVPPMVIPTRDISTAPVQVVDEFDLVLEPVAFEPQADLPVAAPVPVPEPTPKRGMFSRAEKNKPAPVEPAPKKPKSKAGFFSQPLSPAARRVASGEEITIQEETEKPVGSNQGDGFFNPKKSGAQVIKVKKRKRVNPQRVKERFFINVRKLFGIAILVAIIAVVVHFILTPDSFTRIIEGKALQQSLTCTVETVNTTLTFDTSCGRFTWDQSVLPGTPQERLVEGMTYNFQVDGIRFLQSYPYVMTYEAA